MIELIKNISSFRIFVANLPDRQAGEDEFWGVNKASEEISNWINDEVNSDDN